jgi:Peptidase C39 family
LKPLLFLVAFLAAGCAVNPNSDLTAFSRASAANSFEVTNRRLDSQALVLPVLHDRQTEGPSCGAHALASVVNYWNNARGLSGSALYRERPPASPSGYSMAELVTIAQAEGLQASAVRMPQAGLIQELEHGRPVLVPVRLPSIYVQPTALPGENVPALGLATGVLTDRVGRISEWTGLTLVDHYLLVVGHDEDRFIVVEPVRGYRTISARKLGRYREHFGNAAIVFSLPPGSPTGRAADQGGSAPSEAPAQSWAP